MFVTCIVASSYCVIDEQFYKRAEATYEEFRNNLLGDRAAISRMRLMAVAEHADYVIHRILQRPDRDSLLVANTLSLLSAVEHNKDYYRSEVYKCCCASSGEVRDYAVLYLEKQGTKADMPLVSAMLFDPAGRNLYAVSKCLAARGGEAELAVFDYWLETSPFRVNSPTLYFVQAARNRLAQRIGK
jgi:hypothetical protein